MYWKDHLSASGALQLRQQNKACRPFLAEARLRRGVTRSSSRSEVVLSLQLRLRTKFDTKGHIF